MMKFAWFYTGIMLIDVKMIRSITVENTNGIRTSENKSVEKALGYVKNLIVFTMKYLNLGQV